MDDVPIKLILFLIVGAIFVLGKIFSRKDRSDEEPSEGRPRQPSARGDVPLSPEEALEQMFREMQERRKRSQAAPPQAAEPPVRRPPEESRPQTLEEFFGQREEPPAPSPAPPVAKPVPAARPVSQTRPYREPAVRAARPARPPTATRVVLRKPKAAFATAEGPTLAAEQRAKMAESRARVEAAAALAGPDAMKAAQVRDSAKPMVSLAGMRFDRDEAARAIVYLELLGEPRALRPYVGPPAVG